MDTKVALWDNLIAESQMDDLLQRAMDHAARGLSEMTGQPISIDIPRIEVVLLNQVAAYAGDPEMEMVGVYLLMEGDLSGQSILMLPLADALRMVDLLLGVPLGTTLSLGELEKSALAEAGNITLSFFLNQVATLTGLSSRPSPPAVIVDMLGAILDVVATSIAPMSDNLLIVETVFRESHRVVQAHFWVLPFVATLLA